MYHCSIQFYFVGYPSRIFEIIKEMPPLEDFVHTFSASDVPKAELLKKADVILADLSGTEGDIKKIFENLTGGKKEEAELILLADRQQIAFLEEDLSQVRDVWPLPMSEGELRFRFLRWQQAYKQIKDCWQANHFLDACVEGSPNLVWYKDKDGIHEKVNNSFCSMVNKTKEQVQGQRHAYIWDVEQDDPVCIESELEVMLKQKTCIAEETVQIGGGGERLLTTYKSPLYDLDGSVMGTVGVAIDITQERAYEQEIMEKNRMLEFLFASMDCGILSHSTDGKRILSVNESALYLLGYQSQKELMEDGFAMVAQSVVDEDKPKVREAIESLKKPGSSAGVTYRVQHKNGRVLYILGNIKLLELEGKRFYQRFLVDITDQKLKEKEEWEKKDMKLQYQEQIFDIFSDCLANNVDDVYIMLNETLGKVEYMTSNFERVLGVSKEYVEQAVENGRDQYLIGTGLKRREIMEMQPGMNLEPLETERINPKTGEQKWLRESVYCRSVQGRKKIIIYVSDRTKERKVQNNLAEALEMAQVASRAKSNFLSSVSHDIRTPMNAIIGFTALLQEEADHPKAVLEYTRKISDANQHLLALINNVLDINKIESGSTALNIGELNLAEVIDNMKTIILPQAKTKNQSFEIYTNSLVDECLMGDRLRIEQILINILSNAVKYTPEGGRIEMQVMELPKMDTEHSSFRFTVSDNGCGMSEEYQKVIFDPFTREESKTRHEIQGTGLGMAITKSLVDLMNGSIKVTSKLGEGTTFVVELTLQIQKQEDIFDFWEKYGISRMIVADNDEDICIDIVKKMAETGVEVDYVTSGTEAVETIRLAREKGNPYDLILLDWKMPDLDGLGTARLIRKNYPEKIPILLFSAYDWSDIEQEAMEVGVVHFLSKPFFMSNFKDAICKMVEDDQKSPALAGAGDVFIEGKRVLIVDDIEVNRHILMKILSTLGAVCDVAKDGQEALEKFENAREDVYDIIMMDIQMPNMNGYEATKAIRASSHPLAKEVVIIAMTANAFLDDIREALAVGMDAHVAKPIVLEQMKTAIRKALERKEQREDE